MWSTIVCVPHQILDGYCVKKMGILGHVTRKERRQLQKSTVGTTEGARPI
jgi:hypothetical protein